MKTFAPNEFPMVNFWLKLLGFSDSKVKKIIHFTILSIFGVTCTALLGDLIGFVNRKNIQEQAEMLFNIGVLVYFGLTYLAIRSKYSDLLEFLTTTSRAKGIRI